MLTIQKILQKFKSTFLAIKHAYTLIKNNREPLYRIEKLDTVRNRVIIYSRTRAIIKLTFEEALKESMIINGLPPMHACWLGYYYAKSLAISSKEPNRKSHHFNFSIHSDREHFKVISFELRTGMLTYLDTRFNKTYKEKVTNMAQNDYVINNIHPSQACYIGILAGYEPPQHNAKIIIEKPARPVLKIVK